MPQPDSAVLDGLPWTPTDFHGFHEHGPDMRLDNISAPTERFVTRVSAFVDTSGDRLGHALFWPATDATFSR